MALQVKKATRELIWVKIALMGPSGSGKTYSALRAATGMIEELKSMNQEKNGKILLINTEQKRGYYYANEFNYDIVDVEAPHNPERYVDLMNEVVAAEYPVVIIDSTSHEWDGKGGCLELHQMAGGTYQAWAKVTPRHDRFINSIADAPIHVIATMRGKDQYEMEKINDKTVVKKLGVGAKQRDGFEYEFTATFNIDQKSNMATVQKDNTHLFESEGEVKISESHGKKLIQWANSGSGYTPPSRSSVIPHKAEAESLLESNELDSMKKEVIALCTTLGGSSNKALMEEIKKFESSGNPNKIKDIEVLGNLLSSLKTMEKENK